MKKLFLIFLVVLPMSLYGGYVPKDAALKLLHGVSAKDYPKSDAAYISNVVTKLDRRCLGATTTEIYRKILNDRARKSNAVRFWYNTHYHGMDVQAIELVKKDGTVVSFDPAKILEEKDNTFSGSSNIYSRLSKVLTAELPDVQIGDVIYTKEKRMLKNAAMENHFSDSFGIQDSSPYLNKYKEITLPKKKKLYIHDLNNNGLNYDHSAEKKGRNIVYKWNVSNIPIIVPEPHMEQYNLFAHHIKITTIKSWEDISRWYYGIVKPHMKVNDAIRAKVKELVKGAATRREKAARIFYWVAQSIRYLGVDGEKYRPGLEPHDVTYTFETRGGVCRDKSALLTAMFRLAGIDSDVILISAGSRLNFEAPAPWFNHAISLSYDEKGKPEFIFDPTDENTKDFLPKYEEDNTYLTASKKGDTLRLTPVSPPEKNNSTIRVNLALDGAGAAKGKIEFLFSGYADTVLRGYFAQLSPYEIKTTVLQLARILHPNARVSSFTSSDPNDKTQDISITANVDIANYAPFINGHRFIPFEAANLQMHLMYGSIMSPFKLNSREYHFKMPGAFSLDTQLAITFPAKPAKPSIPRIKTFDFEGFKTTMKSQSDGNTLTIGYHFETTGIHFKKKQYLPLKTKISDFLKNDNLYIITHAPAARGGHGPLL